MPPSTLLALNHTSPGLRESHRHPRALRGLGFSSVATGQTAAYPLAPSTLVDAQEAEKLSPGRGHQ
jgi:hypothetical protein